MSPFLGIPLFYVFRGIQIGFIPQKIKRPAKRIKVGDVREFGVVPREADYYDLRIVAASDRDWFPGRLHALDDIAEALARVRCGQYLHASIVQNVQNRASVCPEVKPPES